MKVDVLLPRRVDGPLTRLMTSLLPFVDETPHDVEVEGVPLRAHPVDVPEGWGVDVPLPAGLAVHVGLEPGHLVLAVPAFSAFLARRQLGERCTQEDDLVVEGKRLRRFWVPIGDGAVVLPVGGTAIGVRRRA